MSVLWLGILLTALGCYALKLAGLSVPPALLAHPVAVRVSAMIPVALLAALIAVQVLAAGRELVVDARVLGLAVAAGLLVVRAPFLVVVFAAAAAAAVARLVGWAP